MTKVEAEQYVIEGVNDGDKEKKKRRSNRRSKQNASFASSVAASSSSINEEASACLKNVIIDNQLAGTSNDHSLKKHTSGRFSPTEDGSTSAINVSFSSVPAIHIIEHGDILESQISKNNLSSDSVGISKSCSQLEQGVIPGLQISKYQHVSSNNDGCVMSNSHPRFIACGEPYTHNGHAQRKYFPPHWSMEAVNEGGQKGDVFKAIFRVNAYNKLEAYCKIDGVPTDILINGIPLQNRAVEGDIVAVKVDPVMLWPKMTGSMEVFSDSATMKDSNLVIEDNEIEVHNCKGKCKIGGKFECSYASPQFSSMEASNERSALLERGNRLDQPLTSDDQLDGYHLSNALGNLCDMVGSCPSKRPTGRVVAIIERSPLRNTVVGRFNVNQLVADREFQKEGRKTNNFFSFSDHEFIQLTPTDPRFPKMMVSMRNLPDCIKKRLEEGDATVEHELVGVQIEDWGEENYIPPAQILRILGKGGEIESHINAILFESNIGSCEFSPDLLPWIPQGTWEVPLSEYQERRDLRNLCIFTIDRATATTLDDALSVERLANNISRVGVHIADVSYFVLPDTALDKEAQKRSTSVYLVDRKILMLPPLLSENIGSLNPGENRLAFSIFFDIDHTGDVINSWIGRTIIQSCCKLSYEHAQYIIDGSLDVKSSKVLGNAYPQLHGQFLWHDIITSVKSLNDISKTLRNKRFSNGALRFKSPKVVCLLDEREIPYDSIHERNDLKVLVEEFMILANTAAAKVISRAFPDSALLRRHHKPNIKRLKEFEAFCIKPSLELDVSSSGQFNQSMEQLKQKPENDSVLFDILKSHASRPMQLATYFCSGEFNDNVKDWCHYAMNVPSYTHFTSPLRRYPDIIVHRMLAATVEAEKVLRQQNTLQNVNSRVKTAGRCFTGLLFDKNAAKSPEVREALSAAALRHRLPYTKPLADIAAYCNDRQQASRHAKETCEKLYMWAMLNKTEFLITTARVLGLGPKFMSVYVHKFAIERRIYYDEVEGLTVEWLDITSSLVLSLCTNKRPSKRGNTTKWRALEEVALLVSPCDLKYKHDGIKGSFSTDSDGKSINFKTEINPAVFPLTIRLLSTIPIVVHPIRGDNGPVDIAGRLFTSSYLRHCDRPPRPTIHVTYQRKPKPKREEILQGPSENHQLLPASGMHDSSGEEEEDDSNRIRL